MVGPLCSYRKTKNYYETPQIPSTTPLVGTVPHVYSEKVSEVREGEPRVLRRSITNAEMLAMLRALSLQGFGHEERT